MAALPKTQYTPEQYLALEREADYKSEYINGEIHALAGASREHNLIASNVIREISVQFKGRPCEVYTSDMRVNIGATDAYVYPDAVAVCGEPYFGGADVDVLLNPIVIVEVLSPSTEAYDRGEKFAHYRKLESLREYVLIAQDKARVEHYVREGGHEEWIFTEVSGLEGMLRLGSIGCEVALREMYDKVKFPTATPIRSHEG
jgi:Uma2 family endonuclease